MTAMPIIIHILHVKKLSFGVYKLDIKSGQAALNVVYFYNWDIN